MSTCVPIKANTGRFWRCPEKPQSREQMLEANYGIHAADWLLVRPTLQYVTRPGAYVARPDTFVYVLHVQAAI